MNEVREMRLAIDLLQKRWNCIWRWRRELKNGLDVNIGKAQTRKARAQGFANVPRGRGRHFGECLKDNFVIAIGKCMRAEALEDLGAHLAANGRGTKRREEAPFDFSARETLRLLHR